MGNGTEGEWGITEADRNRILEFASKTRFDRSPEDLQPAEERTEERGRPRH